MLSGIDSEKFSKIGLLLVGATVITVFLIAYVLVSYSIKKTEISLRNQAEAQQKVVLLAHDKMWKVLSNKARITKEFSPEEKIKMLQEVVNGRSGGMFSKTIQENDPTFDLSLLKDFSQSVEAEYALVVEEQKKLLDVVNTHKNYVQDPFCSMFVNNSSVIEAKIISSTRSQNAVESGVDDNPNFLDEKKE